MDKNYLPVWIFSAVMTLVAIGIIWNTAGLCDLQVVTDARNSLAVASCLDFWLNRYQGLLGGFCTLAAALIAGGFVLRQIFEAKKQTSIMLGDISPDFILRGVSKFFSSNGFELLIVNQNRRPIEIQFLRVVSPANIEVLVDFTGTVRVFGRDKFGRMKIEVLISGTRPGAATASQETLTGGFSAVLKSPAEHVGQVSNLVMEIGYEILDEAGIQLTAIRTLPKAKIGGFAVVDEYGAAFQAASEMDRHQSGFG